MDSRLIKGASVLGAMALYALSYHVPLDMASSLREAAALLMGWQGLRRSGDQAPVKPVVVR